MGHHSAILLVAGNQRKLKVCKLVKTVGPPRSSTMSPRTTLYPFSCAAIYSVSLALSLASLMVQNAATSSQSCMLFFYIERKRRNISFHVFLLSHENKVISQKEAENLYWIISGQVSIPEPVPWPGSESHVL